jgi:hypothetical protein
MSANSKPTSRIQKYRARMRREGFRQVNLWVPDTRSAVFARECKRQSRLAARSGNEALKHLDAMPDWTA